jgi:hypothetical protein
VAMLGARADNGTTPPTKVPAAAVGGSLPATPQAALPPPAAHIDFSNSMGSTTDPEEIANQTIALSRQKQETTEPDIEEQARIQKQIADEHDWMLQGYEEQLRKNGLSKAAPDSDPYATQPSKTVGEVPDPLKDSLDRSSQTRKNDPYSQDLLGAEKKALPEDSLTAMSLPPMLPPLASTQTAPKPAHDYFGGPDSFDAPNPADTSPTTSPSSDNSILDVPGLTAARQDGLPDANLNVDDRLPDGPGESASTNPDHNNFALRQPPANDVDAFYKKQTESLQPAGVATVQSPVTLTTPKPYEEPPRIAKPAVDGLRNHVADPFDFLNR